LADVTGNPRVSVIIPTKNRSGVLVEALRSLRDQTFADWDAVVVDDGSVDDTVAVMADICREEPRVRFRRRESAKAGADVCRNEGVLSSGGDYLVFLDSDDCLSRSSLSRRVEAMRGNAELDFAVFQAAMFTREPRDARVLWNVFTGENDLDRFLRTDMPWPIAGPIWTRSAVRRVGPFDEDLPRGQDWDYHVRALALGLRYEKHAEVDLFIRKGGEDHRTVSSTPPRDPRRLWQRRLAEKAERMLADAGMLTAHRKKLLTALYFRYAQALSLESRPEALRFWGQLGRRDGVPGYVYRLGVVHLYLTGVPVVRKVSRRILSYVWPRGMFVHGRFISHQKAPLGELSGRPQTSPAHTARVHGKPER
jgi:glycosyltransferase involved in cell wall biosynthesis